MPSREEIISNFLDNIDDDDLVISSTGKISRELFELRIKRGEPTNDFYMLGSMGCAVAIGLGVSLNTKKTVFVLSGDAALLMKLGSLATMLKYKPYNLQVIVLNNNCHDSTGGQPTNFRQVEDIVRETCVVVINVETGSRKNLGKVKLTPEEIVKNFMDKI